MAISVSRNLNVKLTVNSVDYKRQLDHARNSTKSFAGGVRETLASIGMAIDLIRQAGQALVDIFSKPLQLFAQIEDARVTFAVFLDDVKEANNLIRDIQEFAIRTPFISPELIKASRMLLATGTATEQVIPTLRRLGDLATGVGVPIEELAFIFSKVHAKGRMMGRDLNQFAVRMVPIIAELRKVMGATSGIELTRMVTAGKVGFNELAQALENMTSRGGRFFGMTEKRSQTLSGLWSTMVDNVIIGLQNVGEAMVEGMDLKKFQKSIVVFFQNLIPVIKEHLLPALREIGKVLRVAWVLGAQAFQRFGVPTFVWLQRTLARFNIVLPTFGQMMLFAAEQFAMGVLNIVSRFRLIAGGFIQSVVVPIMSGINALMITIEGMFMTASRAAEMLGKKDVAQGYKDAAMGLSKVSSSAIFNIRELQKLGTALSDVTFFERNKKDVKDWIRDVKMELQKPWDLEGLKPLEDVDVSIKDPTLFMPPKVVEAQLKFVGATEMGTTQAFSTIAAATFQAEGRKDEKDLLKQLVQQGNQQNGFLKDLVGGQRDLQDDQGGEFEIGP